MRMFFAAMLLGLVSCQSKPPVNFSTELDTWLTQRYPANQPGMAICFLYPPDSLKFEKGYGLADLTSQSPITPDTRFNLGSVSKTMVGMAILKLEEAGKLSIEDPILKYFPEFQHPEVVKDVKLKHLLSHTSGIPDNRPVSNDSVYYLTANDAQNFAPLFSTEKLNFQPGEQFQYSNPAFNGLALVVEKVSGQKWQEYVRQQIFIPAGMASSVFTDGAFPDSGVAHGYQKMGNQWKEYDYGEYPTFCASGNGGAWSSVRELLLYHQALLSGTIASKATIEKARTIYQPENWKGLEAPFTGFDWFVYGKKGYPELATIGHTGDQAGFRADFQYYPETGMFLAIVCNDNRELGEVKTKIEELANLYLLHPVKK